MSDILRQIAAERREAYRRIERELPLEHLPLPPTVPVPLFSRAAVPILIAECKKGSPSKGVMAEHYSPEEIAAEYEKGGASALSVLTEPLRFWGRDSHFSAVRSRTALPVLRKDFTVVPYQIDEARSLGADAVLLIAALLSTEEMERLTERAHRLGMQVLLEVHTEEELEKGVPVRADAFGINARNLRDFSMDLDRVIRMRDSLPPHAFAVAESGLHSPEAGARMRAAGFDAFLVGEHFVTASDRAETVRRFVEALNR